MFYESTHSLRVSISENDPDEPVAIVQRMTFTRRLPKTNGALMQSGRSRFVREATLLFFITAATLITECH